MILKASGTDQNFVSDSLSFSPKGNVSKPNGNWSSAKGKFNSPKARKRTRGGASGPNRGPASRTWGGYAQKGRGTGGSTRGPAATTRAPPAIAKFVQRHRGPNNFYRPASTFSLIMGSPSAPIPGFRVLPKTSTLKNINV